MKSVKSDECMELKNIKYKTMLLSGTLNTEIRTSSENLQDLEKFLEEDKNNNKNEPWSKLDKTIKTKKLLSFAEKYVKENNYEEEDEKLLVSFLKDCLDRKKLQRVKDVDYDKTSGEVKDVPALTYNKTTKHFTLKNIDKRVSTLKSLPPKKNRGTIKNAKVATERSNDSESDKE